MGNIVNEVGDLTEILRILKKVISDLEEREEESTIDSSRFGQNPQLKRAGNFKDTIDCLFDKFNDETKQIQEQWNIDLADCNQIIDLQI